MMTYETRDMSGSLFKNTRKEKDTHPDRQGSCRIDGHDYWVSGWIKEGKDGPWLSLAFKRKDGTAARPEPQRGGSSSVRGLDDDIPF